MTSVAMESRCTMRPLSARSSISSRNGKSFSGSYGLTLSADNGHGNGTLSSSLTSSFDNRALPSFSISASRRLHVDHLVGPDAKFLAHFGFTDGPVRHRIAHQHPVIRDRLHHVLVG